MASPPANTSSRLIQLYEYACIHIYLHVYSRILVCTTSERTLQICTWIFRVAPPPANTSSTLINVYGYACIRIYLHVYSRILVCTNRERTLKISTWFFRVASPPANTSSRLIIVYEYACIHIYLHVYSRILVYTTGERTLKISTWFFRVASPPANTSSETHKCIWICTYTYIFTRIFTHTCICKCGKDSKYAHLVLSCGATPRKHQLETPSVGQIKLLQVATLHLSSCMWKGRLGYKMLGLTLDINKDIDLFIYRSI